MLNPIPRCFQMLLLVVSLPILLAAEPAPNRIPLPEGLDLHPVNSTHPDWPVIQKEIDKLEKPRSGNVFKVNRVQRIEGKAIKSLFPDWRFYKIDFTHSAEPGYENVVHLLAAAAVTFAIGPDSDQILRISHYGNYEDFGDLLNSTQTRIKTEEDARLVWQAFCEIHWKAWMDHGLERVSETEWRLGVYHHDEEIIEDELGVVFERNTYSHLASTDSSHRVTGWNLQAEPSWNLVGSDGGLREIFPPPSVVGRLSFGFSPYHKGFGLFLEVHPDGSLELQIGATLDGNFVLPPGSADFRALWWVVHKHGVREEDQDHFVRVKSEAKGARPKLRTYISPDLLPEVFLSFKGQDWKTKSGGPPPAILLQRVEEILQSIEKPSESAHSSESTAQ